MKIILAVRVVLFYAFWCLAVASFFLFMFVGLLFSVRWRGRLMAVCAGIVFFAAKYLLGLDYRLLGEENLPKTACVILSKHQSTWETIAFNRLFFPVCFVLKEELVNIPFFGWGLAMAGSIAINRADGGKALAKIAELGKVRLEQGFNIVIFPEGTRVPPGEHRRYKCGGVLLACRMNTPIVPVALNSGEFMPKGVLLRKTGCVTVSVGPPIDPAGRRPAEVLHMVESWIETETRAISDPAYYRDSPVATDDRPDCGGGSSF